MIFQNISAVFSLCFYIFIYLFFDLFFQVFAVLSMHYWICYFGFSAFWIVLNILIQQVNVTEVEVSFKVEQ